MRVTRRAAVFTAWLTCATASAQCEFDSVGTISNPDDPTCRDARFEYTDSRVAADTIPIGYPVPVPQDSLTGVAGFRTYASLHARHQDLMLTDGNLNGMVVGQTLTSRDIWAYRVGDADNLRPDGTPEAAVLLNGGIHAREWQSPEAVTEVLEQLLEIDTDDGFGQFLSDSVNTVIIPVLNIDGFLQTQRFPISVTASSVQPRDGRMRRKNLRNPSGASPVDDTLATGGDQFLGVDLNRNSARGFGQNNRSSLDPVSLVYRGVQPASEPEIQALLAAAELAPLDRLRFYVDVHSFTQVFFIQRTPEQRLNDITAALSTRMRAVGGNRYRASFAATGGEIGLTADYFGLAALVPSWTLEIEPLNGGQDYGGTGVSHSGFILPDAEVPRMRDEIADMLLLGYYRMAGPPAVRAAEIVRRSDQQVVYRAEWQFDAGSGRRTLNVPVNEGLTEQTGYTLWVAFDKPMRYSDDGASTADYPGQDVADFATVAFDAGSADADLSIPVPGDASTWLAQPGGAPDGYLRYRFDAFAADFDVPALASDTALALSIEAQDLALNALDANPETVADFASGHWVGYETSLGDELDDGGVDCTLGTFARTAASQAAAPTAVTCKASAPPAPPPPVVTPPPAPSRSGGGGGAPAAVILCALLATGLYRIERSR